MANPGSTEDAIFEMLHSWRDRQPFMDREDTSISHLREALVKGGKRRISEQLFPSVSFGTAAPGMKASYDTTTIDLQRQLQEKQAQIDELREEKEKQVEALQTKHSDNITLFATKELDQDKRKKDFLESQLTHLNNKYRASQIENNNLKVQNMDLEISLTEATSTATKELDNVKREKDHLESQLTFLKNKYRMSQTEIENLKKRNMSLENSMNQEPTILQESEESHQTRTRTYTRNMKKTHKRLSPLQNENQSLSKSMKPVEDRCMLKLQEILRQMKGLERMQLHPHGRPVICRYQTRPQSIA